MNVLATAVAGFFAQLIDGGLGMGFGITSTSLLVAIAAVAPAAASAIVHTAQLGTALVAGVSHSRFGNIDWKIIGYLAIPGALGSFLGANVLSRLSTEFARPVMTAVLAGIGLRLTWRFWRGTTALQSPSRPPHSRAFVSALGLLGGFIAATGGGGWGPVTTSTLLTAGRLSPRRVVGTVNTAELLVSAAAVTGFVFGLWGTILSYLPIVFALLVGGALAAPVGAWLVSRLNPTLLGGFVGTFLVALNLPAFLFALGLPTWAVWALTSPCLAFCLVAAFTSYRKKRVRHIYNAKPSHATAPVTS